MYTGTQEPMRLTRGEKEELAAMLNRKGAHLDDEVWNRYERYITNGDMRAKELHRILSE